MGKPVLPEQVEALPADWKDKTIQGFAENILRLGRECRELSEENKALKAEVKMLEGRVRYWKIEAECDHGRWLRCLEDLEHMRNLK